MDPVSAILTALVAGATAAASQTATQAIKDAYQGLNIVLVDTYKLVSASLLEKKPSSAAYQQAVHDELKEHPGLAEDKIVLEKAKVVKDALGREAPEKVAAWGVNIEELEAAGNFIAERISGAGGGLTAKKIKAGGNVELREIAGGVPSSGN